MENLKDTTTKLQIVSRDRDDIFDKLNSAKLVIVKKTKELADKDLAYNQLQ